MVTLAEKTDSEPRIIDGKNATSVSLAGEIFSFTPEGKTMAMRGFDIVNPQEVSPTLRDVAHAVMKERGITTAERAQPANDFAKLVPQGLATGLTVAEAHSIGSQPILATNITLSTDSLGRA